MNSDIEIEFAVNGYMFSAGGSAYRIFKTVDELTGFLNKNLAEYHSETMKTRDTVMEMGE